MDFAINRHLGRLLRPDGHLTATQCLTNLAADPDIAKHFEGPRDRGTEGPRGRGVKE